MELANKVALITGGGTGIGRAIAQAFAAEGAQVVIVGRRMEKLLEAAVAIGQGRVHCCAGDVSDRRQTDGLVAEVTKSHGRIDILVNCAGVNVVERAMARLKPDDWDQVLNVNATGVFNLIHAVLPQMRERKDGLIITIGSIAGLRPSLLGGSAYSASKFAAHALTLTTGLEEKDHGIRCTVIAPGEVETPILDARPVPVTAEHRARILQPEEVAAAALFVACLPPRACVPELIIKPTSQAFA